MEIELCNVTFEVNKILDFSYNLFIESLSIAKLNSPYTKPILFSFYENYISDPIDNLKNGCNVEKLDFYEIILIMSWALYREWTKKVVDEGCNLNCFDKISKEKVLELFFDNLNCEEGLDLLNRLE